MNELTHTVEPDVAGAAEDAARLRARLYRGMCWTIALAVVGSVLFAQWRVTTGVLLGGVLALFNYHWLQTSVTAILDGLAPAEQMRQRIVARFVLRYFIVAAVIIVAAMLDVVSVAATLAGMSAFVVALMVEASAQMYTAIVHREKF
ncbi:MAG: ATP synthase subunit I [Pyrinomonadaceae bacterium]